MPELSDAEKRKIFLEVRDKERSDRKRVRPTYVTVSTAEARKLGYRPVTAAFSTRQFDQCAMLDKVVGDFRECDIKLVRVGVRKNNIEVWRKTWDRHTAPKSVHRAEFAPMKDTPLFEFLESILSSLSSVQ